MLRKKVNEGKKQKESKLNGKRSFKCSSRELESIHSAKTLLLARLWKRIGDEKSVSI